MEENNRPFSIAILAGGSSSRFQSEKALMHFEGQLLVQRAVSKYCTLSPDVFFQLRKDQTDIISAIGDIEGYDVGIYHDSREGIGPLSGIVDALKNANHDHVFMVAVDLPHIDERLVRSLSAMMVKGIDVAVPRWDAGYLEPLSGLYSKNLIAPLETFMENGARGSKRANGKRGPGIQYAITRLTDSGHRATFLNVEDFLREHGLERHYFANINHPQDCIFSAGD